MKREDDSEFEFFVLSMPSIRFVGRKISMYACSELKTRTRSRPRSTVWRSLITITDGIFTDTEGKEEDPARSKAREEERPWERGWAARVYQRAFYDTHQSISQIWTWRTYFERGKKKSTEKHAKQIQEGWDLRSVW